MSGPVALVTGAGGELGRLLLPHLATRGYQVVGVDLAALGDETKAACVATFELDILDRDGLRGVFRGHRPTHVFHLAALLSSDAERDPERAHRVNVEGTLGLFRLCREEADGPVRFLFPSSIAVYGLPDARTKDAAGALDESEWNRPAGVYGCNKLYCELIGAHHTREAANHLDFRAVRFPGLISAETLPTGGTTDFAPEMVHAAASGQPYACFVGERTRLPFMTMPDAVESLLRLTDADVAALTTRVYNIKGFACSAGELREAVLRHFPRARIRFEPSAVKQALVDTWPADLDDARARGDWGHAPGHGLDAALSDYLVPALRRRYAAAAS